MLRSEREQLIVDHLPLVERLARRYRTRGEPIDDLIQAGSIGLIKAVDRFDPTRGTELAAFAAPTILGEIRRHFRDRTWMVNTPRSIQELRVRVGAAIDELSAQNGRSPSIREIAESLGVDSDDVIDALAAASAHRPDHLADAPEGGDEPPPASVGVEDPGFARVDSQVTLAAATAGLSERDRLILELRFERGLTQSEIAGQLGISQMHVSRLLRRALTALRKSDATQGAGPGEEAPGGSGAGGDHGLV